MLSFYLAFIDDIKNDDRFVAVYRTHTKQMVEIAYEVLGNAFDAEDAVHNAFYGIAVNFPKINRLDDREMQAYCYRAARNSALNILSKKKIVYACDDIEDRCLDETKDLPLEELVERESIDRIVAAVITLPSAYRDTLRLYLVDEMKPREIASLFGVSVATVKKRIERGKKMLQKKLTEEDIINV